MTKLFDVDTRLKDLEQELADAKTSQEELLSQIDKRFDSLRDQLARKDDEIRRKDSQIKQAEAEKEMLRTLTGRLFNMIHNSTRNPLADRLRALDDRLKKLVVDEPMTAEPGRLSGTAEPHDEPVAEDCSKSDLLSDKKDSSDDVDSSVEQLGGETTAPTTADKAASYHAA